jgi:hypothetical protein
MVSTPSLAIYYAIYYAAKGRANSRRASTPATHCLDEQLHISKFRSAYVILKHLEASLRERLLKSSNVRMH